MIEIEVSLYKYGEFKETQIFKFENEEGVFSYIETGKSNTEEVDFFSKKYGESTRKWTESFSYKGVCYTHDVDC